jgi:hypothetical protein
MPNDSSTPQPRRVKTRGHKAGAQNFSEEDKEFLITVLEDVRPIGPEMWEQVMGRYNEEYATPNQRNVRDKDALRTQYYKMYKTSKPTGDPTCPDYVRRAKTLKREIEDEIAMVGINDNDLESQVSEIDEDHDTQQVARGVEITDDNSQEIISDPIDDNETQPVLRNATQHHTSIISSQSTPSSSQLPPRPISLLQQARKPRAKPSPVRDDDFVSAMLKSINPEAAAERNDCNAIDCFMRTQVTEYRHRI